VLSAVDHVAIAAPDPDAAAAELERRLGLQATGGGRHPGAGTFNRIVWLADAYVELIGVDDREAAARHPLGAATLAALDDGGGLAGYALLSAEVDATVARLQAAGSHIGPVIAGERVRQDGERVQWWTAMPERLGPDGLPFLIRHALTGAEWDPTALAERQRLVHPLGGPAVLIGLDLAVSDPVERAADYWEQLGLEFWAVGDVAVCTVGRHTLRLVPRSRMDATVSVNLGAPVDEQRACELLNVRFNLQPVELPLPAS
jgi:catechol 2,3-dioxygenase-like lactoylglutathione lyase family enzyme